jgi:hypothetical protein
LIPEVLCYYREWATHYYNPGFGWQMRCRITGSDVTLWTWDLGIAFDTVTNNMEIEIFDLGSLPEIIFTETPLELMGFDVTGDVVIASAKLIRLMDDVRVGGPTSGPPEYRVAENNPNYIVIASEGDIKVANTIANGHGNSNGLGNSQTNPSFSDIVITAALYALGNPATGFAGSFTFENQNDPDSGYVYGSFPDDRGQIFLYGALAQRRRGYLHRSNNTSTGYLKQIRWDERLRTRPEMVIGGSVEELTTDTLFFGDIPVDSTVWDTAYIRLICPGALGTPMASQPYQAYHIPPFFGSTFRVPVRFTPPHVGNFPGMLQVQTNYRLFQIPLRGRGVTGDGPNITEPGAYPNPFNSSAAITFEVTVAGQATLEIFDITGRRVMTAFDQHVEPGTQRVIINGESLSTGIYFARLHTPSQERTLKLMLIK